MKVAKFGGTSMRNASTIAQCVSIILSSKEPVWIVVSALKGTTELLLKIGQTAAIGDESYQDSIKELEQRHLNAVKELIPVINQSSALSGVKKMCNDIEDIAQSIFRLRECSLRTKDTLSGYGELLSSAIMQAALASENADSVWKDTRSLIVTDDNHTRATVLFEKTNQNIASFAASVQSTYVVFPGFVAATEQGVTTTLGRNSSDYSAAILAAGAKATSLEIWTDVDGMKTADPNYVKNARTIPFISYEDAMELSHFGAKVIYPPTLLPVMQREIPTLIKNTFEPEKAGTLIGSKQQDDRNIIKGISSIDHIALLSLEGSGMVGVPGFAARLFAATYQHGINVVLITQSSSEHSICIAVSSLEADNAKQIVDAAFEKEIQNKLLKATIVEKDLSILALVGEEMKSRHGVSGKMFSALGKNAVNIRAIAQGASERNISAVIASADVAKALNVLHEDFFENTLKQINLYICGLGNVGSKLIEQIRLQSASLKEKLRVQLKVVGLCNSTRALIDKNGIDLNVWQQAIKEAPETSIHKFSALAIDNNLRNSILVDVTANESVAAIYGALLQKGIGVVACNKIAAASSFQNYSLLKNTATAFNAAYLFETNVGAGLPVIGTLNDMVTSGDRLLRAEAVLSGTLNFVFNEYNGTTPFVDVVKKAKELGFTEPDPRLDLGGLDVMRKILILAREAGYVMELDEVANNSFLPQGSMEGSIEDFYQNLANNESHFKDLYQKAAEQNCKLKFVAKLENGKASVGLKHVAPEEDMYHLYGKDNVVLFYTERYQEQPLVVKGAGAGAEVTASGVFADILRAAKN